MIVTTSEARRIADERLGWQPSRRVVLVSNSRLCFCLLFAIVAVGGCSTAVQRNDWSAYTGPGAEHFRKQEYKLPYVPDPLEPTNRVAWAANDFVLFGVIEPVTAVWRFLVPQCIRSHLVNAAENITYPVRAVNNLLQGKFDKARDETHRFVINTTVGVLGLFDPAAEWGIAPAPEDLGLTFVQWGWTDSHYVVVPFLGPSTVRDAIGEFGDLFLDPTTYFYPAGWVTRFVEGSEVIGGAKHFVRTNYDAYGLVRQGWTISRSPNVVELEAADGAGPAAQTLGVALLRNHDLRFFSRARSLAVELQSTGEKLPYEVWMHPGVAPIIYIVPGMGAHRRASEVLALASMAYQDGFSVVTISSAFNFEFMQKAATVPTPGFAPADAGDVHTALSAISRDLEQRFPNRIGAQVMMGLSLGAFHGLYIAAGAAGADDSLIDFDRYVLLNPPVALRYAAEQLDTFYNVPLTFPEAHRDEHVRAILSRIAGDVVVDSNAPAEGILLSEDDAKFLIGLSFRVVLHDTIWCSQDRHDSGVLKSPLDRWRRAPVSDEIFDFSFIEYFYAFVLPWYTGDEYSIDAERAMFTLLDARSLTRTLPRDGTVRVFSSENDFLLTGDDRHWLIDTLGESNVTFEPTGGHAGSLRKPEVQQRIMNSLEDLLPVGPPTSTDD